MAKQLTKTELVEQNESLSDQVSGLQSEVEELDAAISEVYDHNDELEQRNDVLQSALVSFQETNDRLNETIDQKETLLNLADVIILAAGEFEKVASAKIADLEQENFHLTIQLAAAKDKVKELTEAKHAPVTVYYRNRVFTDSAF